MTKEEIQKVEALMKVWIKLNDFEKRFVQGLYKIRFGNFKLSEKQKKALAGTNK